MRKKSTYVVLIVILLVFFVVMFLVFGVNSIKKDHYDLTLIVGDNTVWTYNKRSWLNLRSQTAFKDLSWKKYDVYSNNENVGNYYLWHDDKWYVFDDEKNAINIDGSLLAIDSNYKVNVHNFDIVNVDADSYIMDVLESNSLSTSSLFTSSYKVSFDFDNDGEVEDFYVISNAFPMDFNPDEIFSIVFMVKNNKIYYLYNDISANRGFNGCKPFINSILDVDNDKKYELVISCGKYSIGEQVDMLYQFKDNQFKIIISNQ